MQAPKNMILLYLSRWNGTLLEKLTVAQIVNKLGEFTVSKRAIFMFNRVLAMSPYKSSPHFSTLFQYNSV
jgi:hypothetical protein